MGHRAGSIFTSPGVYWTRLWWYWSSMNLSSELKVLWAYTPGCSRLALTCVPYYSVYSTPRVSSTLPVKTPFRCPEFPCQKKFTSDSWRLKHIKLQHPEHLHVAPQKNLSICSAPSPVQPTHRREFTTNKDWVEDFDVFPSLEHIEIIADSHSQPPPPALPWEEISAGASALLSNYIAELWECDAQGCLDTNLQSNSYYPCATCEEYKDTKCRIKKNGTKTYCDNILKKGNTALRFGSFKNGNGVQNLVGSMPDDPLLMEKELHTLDDMRWNYNHQYFINYWSRDIIKSMRWLMQQPATTEHHIYTPQYCINSYTPPKRLYTEMHTADWWWEPQGWRDSRG